MDPQALRKLGIAQDGVVTRAQLRACGFDRWAVRNRIASGRWQPRGNRVVVLHNGPSSARQRWWIGVLHGGTSAVLAGRSAATSYGLSRMDDGKTHVLVPQRSNVPPLPGVRVHESAHAVEMACAGGLPRQPLAESLVSAATWAPRADVAAGLLASGVQRRAVGADDLRRALGRAGPVRHARLLRQVIADIAGGAESFAEIDAVRLARRAGIPRPRQQSLRVVGGRRRYLDVDFGTWAMEIDGAAHENSDQFAADLLRHDDLVLAGERILRFAALTVRLQPDAVVDRMKAAHRTWT